MDDARAEFSQQRSRLTATAGDEMGEVALPEAAPDVGVGGANGFMQWMQIGFAFTLPLIVFGLIALIIFLWVAARVQ